MKTKNELECREHPFVTAKRIVKATDSSVNFLCKDNDLLENKNLLCDEIIFTQEYNIECESDIGQETCLDLNIDYGKLRFVARKQFNHEVFDNTYDTTSTIYLISQEEIYKVKIEYLETNQKNLLWSMRAMLLDWLQEVCSDFHYNRETFHYCVNYVDRYLSFVHHIQTRELQLIGLGALFLAAKTEEILTPKINSILAAANNSYNQEQVLAIEAQMCIVIL